MSQSVPHLTAAAAVARKISSSVSLHFFKSKLVTWAGPSNNKFTSEKDPECQPSDQNAVAPIHYITLYCFIHCAAAAAHPMMWRAP
jgi:hypothetical protein